MKKLFCIGFFLLYPMLWIMGQNIDVSAASVVLKETTVVFDGEKFSKKTHLIIQVNSLSDDKHCKFSIPYSKNFRLKLLSAMIKGLDGTLIRNLSKKEIITSSDFTSEAFYSDHKIKQFSLIHRQYPYFIDLTYEYEYSNYLGIIEWNPVWESELSTQQASLSFTYPKGYRFRHKDLRVEKPICIQDDNNNETLVWIADYKVPKAFNRFMPPYDELSASVSIVPIQFTYDLPGSFESWKHFGNWQVEIGRELDDLPDFEKSKIDQLTKGITDNLEIIRILYHYLQDNCRYLQVDIKFGGMVPYPASYVAARRYGDCKALSNYMKAMLAYKGVGSFLVDVNSGENASAVYPDFPEQAFNHVMLAVPVERDTMWLECTSNTSPLGALSESTHNRYGLLVAPNASRLVKIPALTSEQVESFLYYQFDLSDQHKQILNTSFRFKGKWANYLKQLNTEASVKEREDGVEGFFPFKQKTLNKWEINFPHRDSTSVVLHASLEVESPIQSIAHYFKVHHPPMYLPQFEKPAERVYSLHLPYPISISDTLVYHFNAFSYALNDSIQIEKSSPFGQYSIHRKKIDDSTLLVTRTIKIPIQSVSVDLYSGFYGFYQELLSCSGSTVLIAKNP